MAGAMPSLGDLRCIPAPANPTRHSKKLLQKFTEIASDPVKIRELEEDAEDSIIFDAAAPATSEFDRFN